jgi:hypothetical protein
MGVGQTTRLGVRAPTSGVRLKRPHPAPGRPLSLRSSARTSYGARSSLERVDDPQVVLSGSDNDPYSRGSADLAAQGVGPTCSFVTLNVNDLANQEVMAGQGDLT